MYKIITISIFVAITIITLVVIKNTKPMTVEQEQVPSSTISPIILQKFDESYPLKSLFPFRTNNISADYRLEPKTIYVILKNKISNDSALNEIDTYLLSKNESVKNLKDKGVIFIFTKPNTENAPSILD